MRQLLAIFLLTIFLIPGLSKIKTVVDFKMNQDYISQMFCINTDTPSLMCHGKCFLGKQLLELTDQENEDLPNQLNQNTKSLQFIKPSIVKMTSKQLVNKELQGILEHQPHYTSSYLEDIFHPPELV